MNETTPEYKPSLDDYQEILTGMTCKWCTNKDKAAPLGHQTVQHYEHDGGWPLEGHDKLQWLYVVCPKCDYQWSLWKLGVARYNPEAQ